MNYNQKRTLIGRAIYIGLTLMAVTVLCVTMYTFFGSSKQSGSKNPQLTTENVTPPSSTTPTPELPPVTDEPTPPDTSDSKPTVVPDEKDWSKVILKSPVDGVVMKEHSPVNAVFSQTMNDYRVHMGIDIECNLGDDVYACAYGTVIAVGIDPFMGGTVSIDHGDGLISHYKNLNPEMPEDIVVGAEIFEGDVIGSVGESAIIEIAEEPHLHFELVLNDKQIDPETMLESSNLSAPTE